MYSPKYNDSDGKVAWLHDTTGAVAVNRTGQHWTTPNPYRAAVVVLIHVIGVLK